ncbi:tRNA(Ile2) 2-agmatinylcytidine synthetase TiaS [Halolamina pelagica]|uniref:tRNA(Ile2) 2-agmatinylcytidine synthetase TiaS n=1 Tax=Halolamina pelagica TaxID=699431 RepID=A0A0P7GM24_9EURY|nr:tRNA(Ile2) 2-agmatinylcytidine synthetase TiaS [Halolamina pelagica]
MWYPRAVDEASLFAAADEAYPDAWDTVDRVEDEAVCVPSAPGPILYGLRGDDPAVLAAMAGQINSEPVERTALFRTNQGTDAHLRDVAVADLSTLRDGRAYRVDCVVAGDPETRAGGHVFAPIRGTRARRSTPRRSSRPSGSATASARCERVTNSPPAARSARGRSNSRSSRFGG